MSHAVIIPLVAPNPLSIGMAPNVFSFAMLLDGIRQLGMAIQQLNELQDQEGQCCGKVDLVIKTQDGDQIGIRKTENSVDFVVTEPNNQRVLSSIDKVKQMYARLKVLDQAKRSGYQQVKEERLPDGSIRMVVQKWR